MPLKYMGVTLLVFTKLFITINAAPYDHGSTNALVADTSPGKF